MYRVPIDSERQLHTESLSEHDRYYYLSPFVRSSYSIPSYFLAIQFFLTNRLLNVSYLLAFNFLLLALLHSTL